jgi:hypothetical protein
VTPAAPLVNPRPVRCPRCGAALGEEDGDTLALGGVLINRRTALVCRACKNVWGWRPGRRQLEPPPRPPAGLVPPGCPGPAGAVPLNNAAKREGEGDAR